MALIAYELPLIAAAQKFFVRLSGTDYSLSLRWNPVSACWMLTIADGNQVPLVSSIPVITGRDLLSAFRAATGLPGALVADTDHDPDAPPTYANLGVTGHLYYITSGG